MGTVTGTVSCSNGLQGTFEAFEAEAGYQSFSTRYTADLATNQFKAEYGKSQGTIITVLTKSGTNELHGSVFGFLRDDTFQSLSYFDKKLLEDLRGAFEKPKFSRYNVGGSVGGPITKDRTHFFLAVERVQEKNFVRVDMLGQDVWNEYKGLFEQPFNQNLLTLNLTHQLGPRHGLKLRYGNQYDKTENLGFGGEYALENGFSSKNINHNLMLAHTWIIKPNVLNEARAVY